MTILLAYSVPSGVAARWSGNSGRLGVPGCVWGADLARDDLVAGAGQLSLRPQPGELGEHAPMGLTLGIASQIADALALGGRTNHCGTLAAPPLSS
ncbi:hypothetical protein [Streptomyces fungicidicus]